MTTIIDEVPAEQPEAPTRVVSTAVVPIISGFHPDPTICRVGDDYYVAHSSFEYFPGVPLWHSRDLFTWEQIGNVLDRPDQFLPGSAPASQGIFAPTLRFHEGRFWLITTDVGDQGGQLVVWAADPRGPWSDPVRIPELVGIDPDLAWDHVGCLVTYRSTDPTATGIAQARVDLATGSVLTAPRMLWQGTGLAFPEAPHLYQRGAWWYLLIAEGGTERGHCVSVARSREAEGPFEGLPGNPILTHRSTDSSVQNTGHADLVELADGTWSMVYLGVRPRGVTPLFHVLGRETFLAGIDWVDDWPRVDETRFQRPVAPTSFAERFSGDPLAPRWVSPGVAISDISDPRPTGLQLTAGPADRNEAAAIVTRLRDLWWRFEVDVEVGDGELAAIVRLDDRHTFEVAVSARRAVGRAWIGGLEHVTQRMGLESGDAAVTVFAEAVPSLSHGPDDVIMGISREGVDHALLHLDGRYLSSEVAGGFTGRVVGIRPVAGTTTALEVRYVGRDEEATK